jgi:hypothetical protein
MRRETKIALAIGIPVVIGLGAYLAYKTYSRLKKYLYISVGEGGTTLPAPGTYMYNVGENVTITAFPDEGYTVGTWTVDGVEVARQVGSITVTMDADHNVIVTFWKGGVPPPTAPVGIKSLGSVTVVSNVGAWITGTPCWDQHINVYYFGNNWESGKFASYPLKFQVFDAGGNGVPNVDVALWTETPPDSGRYRGTTLLDGDVHTINKPLVKKTDGNGVVSVDVSYLYGLDDHFKTLCSDAGVEFQVGTCFPLPVPSGVWEPAWHCKSLMADIAVFWTRGECETGRSGCERMGDWTRNRVYARIVGTALETAELAYCGFHVKWV